MIIIYKLNKLLIVAEAGCKKEESAVVFSKETGSNYNEWIKEFHGYHRETRYKIKLIFFVFLAVT
jgi:hypothetical protein